MPCNYHTLYFSEEGFVARCKSCGHFHVAFMSFMFVLPEDAFDELYRETAWRMQCTDSGFAETSKSVMIPTHTKWAFIMLTRNELSVFFNMLEEADNEHKALQMISLFNNPGL
ncbi:MAG: hypothetical protein QM687_09550 [Ferruginibacter sp.]